MTAHQTFCLLDLEDGYRTVLTVEDGDTEQGAIARLVIVTDDKRTISIGLSPEAVDGLIAELQRRVSEEGSDA